MKPEALLAYERLRKALDSGGPVLHLRDELEAVLAGFAEAVEANHKLQQKLNLAELTLVESGDEHQRAQFSATILRMAELEPEVREVAVEVARGAAAVLEKIRGLS